MLQMKLGKGRKNDGEGDHDVMALGSEGSAKFTITKLARTSPPRLLVLLFVFLLNFIDWEAIISCAVKKEKKIL
mgnify:CR=1 FL=1